MATKKTIIPVAVFLLAAVTVRLATIFIFRQQYQKDQVIAEKERQLQKMKITHQQEIKELAAAAKKNDNPPPAHLQPGDTKWLTLLSALSYQKLLKKVLKTEGQNMAGYQNKATEKYRKVLFKTQKSLRFAQQQNRILKQQTQLLSMQLAQTENKLKQAGNLVFAPAEEYTVIRDSVEYHQWVPEAES
jgi:hypothetical protein